MIQKLSNKFQSQFIVFVIAIVIMFLLAGCQSTKDISLANDSNLSSNPKPPCSDAVSQSICGTDGKTYPSQCELYRVNGTKIAYFGTCQSVGTFIDDSNCKDDKELVCAYNGYTYMNKCLAQFYNKTVSFLSSCPPIDCKKEGTVCASDGKTYANECTALRLGATISNEGRCVLAQGVVAPCAPDSPDCQR